MWGGREGEREATDKQTIERKIQQWRAEWNQDKTKQTHKLQVKCVCSQSSQSATEKEITTANV